MWAKESDEAVRFRLWPIAGTHRPTFCVWELGAVCHEQQAWGRYLRTTRHEAAAQAYLRDSFAGRSERPPLLREHLPGIRCVS